MNTVGGMGIDEFEGNSRKGRAFERGVEIYSEGGAEPLTKNLTKIIITEVGLFF
jgi:hypothetical protein